MTTYLSRELTPDRVARTITFRQSVYVCMILQIYCAWDKPAVKTLLEEGTRLSKEDELEFVNPALHHRYRGITAISLSSTK